MAYLNLDLDYFEHPKTVRLVATCGESAESAPIKLWCHAGKFCPESGLLRGYAPAEVEAFAKWRGAPGALVAGLLKVGFLHQTPDGYQLHEWLDHEGHLIAFKERSRKANAARWESIKDASRTPNGDGKESPLPYLTNQALKDAFAQLWAAYPKKKSKDAAYRAFEKRKFTSEQFQAVLAALERAKTSKEWAREEGRFIPYPASWLNAGGWQDEHTPMVERRDMADILDGSRG